MTISVNNKKKQAKKSFEELVIDLETRILKFSVFSIVVSRVIND